MRIARASGRNRRFPSNRLRKTQQHGLVPDRQFDRLRGCAPSVDFQMCAAAFEKRIEVGNEWRPVYADVDALSRRPCGALISALGINLAVGFWCRGAHFGLPWVDRLFGLALIVMETTLVYKKLSGTNDGI